MMPAGMSPYENASPARNAVLPSCVSSIFTASAVLALPAAIAAGSRLSGGVRTMPQNTGVIAGPSTDSCQSIHWLAGAGRWGAGERARVRVGRLEHRRLVLGRQIAHDRVRLPQQEAVLLLERRHQTVGVH